MDFQRCDATIEGEKEEEKEVQKGRKG